MCLKIGDKLTNSEQVLIGLSRVGVRFFCSTALGLYEFSGSKTLGLYEFSGFTSSTAVGLYSCSLETLHFSSIIFWDTIEHSGIVMCEFPI